MRSVLIAMVLAATSTATIAQWYPDSDPRSPNYQQYLQQQRDEFNKRQRDEEARNKAHAEEMYGQKPSSPSGGSSAGTGAGRTDFRALGKELLRLPPLPVERNVLLGSWRLERRRPSRAESLSLAITGKGRYPWARRDDGIHEEYATPDRWSATCHSGAALPLRLRPSRAVGPPAWQEDPSPTAAEKSKSLWPYPATAARTRCPSKSWARIASCGRTPAHWCGSVRPRPMPRRTQRLRRATRARRPQAHRRRRQQAHCRKWPLLRLRRRRQRCRARRPRSAATRCSTSSARSAVNQVRAMSDVRFKEAAIEGKVPNTNNLRIDLRGSACDDPRIKATLYDFDANEMLQSITLVWDRPPGPAPAPIFQERVHDAVPVPSAAPAAVTGSPAGRHINGPADPAGHAGAQSAAGGVQGEEIEISRVLNCGASIIRASTLRSSRVLHRRARCARASPQ